MWWSRVEIKELAAFWEVESSQESQQPSSPSPVHSHVNPIITKNTLEGSRLQCLWVCKSRYKSWLISIFDNDMMLSNPRSKPSARSEQEPQLYRQFITFLGGTRNPAGYSGIATLWIFQRYRISSACPGDCQATGRLTKTHKLPAKPAHCDTKSLLIANTFFSMFQLVLKVVPRPIRLTPPLKSWSFCSFKPCHFVLPCYSCWSFRKPTDRPSKSLLESSSNAYKAFLQLWNHQRVPSGKLTPAPEKGRTWL